MYKVISQSNMRFRDCYYGQVLSCPTISYHLNKVMQQAFDSTVQVQVHAPFSPTTDFVWIRASLQVMVSKVSPKLGAVIFDLILFIMDQSCMGWTTRRRSIPSESSDHLLYFFRLKVLKKVRVKLHERS